MDTLTTPLNWQRVRIGDICEIVKGQQINKISLNNTDKYPVINGGIDFLGYTNKFNVSKNTIAISEGGTCGYVRFMKGDFWSGGHNYSLQKISNKVNNLCLYHILKSYEKDIMKLGVGSGLKNIQLKALKDFEIPLPPLNEQIAIANILSDVDRYLYSLDALILKKESVKKALSFELLSQRKRLKGFNQAWQRVRIGDIAEIKRGASPRPIENPKWFCANSNVGWVRISDISKNSRFLYKTAQKLSKKGIEKSRLVKQNSLIMSMCATIGKPIITKIDTCIHDGFVVFENPKIDLNYLYYFLCYIEKEWLESGQQGSQVNLNVDLIKNKEVFYPKDLNEQIAIANVLSGLDNEITSLKNKKRQFENIKKALNHDLMSAKIRVLKK
ncbi:restriction endonuclease subunit S [Helicobacter pylori]